MQVTEVPLVERVARVLAAAAHSSNADGTESSAAKTVDLVWHQHVNQALAVIRTMREPDDAMIGVGDEKTWSNMIDAALGRSGSEG